MVFGAGGEGSVRICYAAEREAVADDKHEYCYACYTGDYPTELVNIEALMTEKERRG